MKPAMVWVDNDQKKKFEQKVLEAVTYYDWKYTGKALYCYVHPDNKGADVVTVENRPIKVFPLRRALKNDFWITEEPLT